MGNLSKFRLSLKFSEKDSDQTEVVNLLKQMGRRKSQFITKAVKYYLEKEPEAEIPMPKAKNVDREQMKNLLRELLEEMSVPDNVSPATPKSSTEIKEIHAPKEEHIIEKSDEELMEDMDDFLSGLDEW